jgi:hypothetical protein
MKSTEQEADRLFKIGNFLAAKKIYSKLRNKSDFESKRYFDGEIESCGEYNRQMSYSEIGEAMLPVYDKATGTGSVFTLKVGTSSEYSREFDITDLKKEVTDFLDKILADSGTNNFRMHVLDWQTEHLKAYLKPLPNENDEFKEFANNADGNSFQLAASIALISYITKSVIKPIYAFSGVLEPDLKLGKIGLVKEKLDALSIERPKVKKLFISSSDGKLKDSRIIRPGSFSDIVDTVFPKFASSPEETFSNIGNLRRISLTINKSNDIREGMKGNKFRVFCFDHPKGKDGKVFDHELKSIFEFLKNVSLLAKGSSDGIILDGLILSCMNPAFCMVKGLANDIGNFLAVRFSNTEDGKVKAAVITSTKNAKGYEPGDVILYKECRKI